MTNTESSVDEVKPKRKWNGYRFDCMCAALCLPLLTIVLYFGTVKQLEAGGCPIVFDLSGNGEIDITGHNSSEQKLYTLFSIGRYVSFDIFGSGDETEIDWIEPNKDAFLVDLRKGFPKKANGNHLFGVANGEDGDSFQNGFEKLATLDKNKNGSVEGPELNGIALWKDNGDAIMEKSEIIQLSEIKILSIPTKPLNKVEKYGFQTLYNNAYTENGNIYFEDIWFMNSGQPTRLDQIVGWFLHPFG